MNDAYDLSVLPERRLSVSEVITLMPNMTIGDAANYAKRDMAMRIAAKIVEKSPFFNYKYDTSSGAVIMTFSVDCVVLTSEELRELRLSAYTKGVHSATGAGFQP